MFASTIIIIVICIYLYIRQNQLSILNIISIILHGLYIIIIPGDDPFVPDIDSIDICKDSIQVRYERLI